MRGRNTANATAGAGTTRGGGPNRRTVLRTGVAGGALVLAGATPLRRAFGQARRLVVTTMPGPRWEGALRASAAAFEAANPGVEIDIVVSPYAEHYQRIGTSLIEDASDFDIHLFDPVLIGQSWPKLQPLGELFDSDPEWRDYYLEGVPYFYRGSWDWDGEPFSVVHDANCMMGWWRTDLFREHSLPEPASFEQILENAKALNEISPESGFMTCAGRTQWFLGMTFTGMLHSFGGRWYENDVMDAFGRIDPNEGSGEILLDSDEAVAAARMLLDLSKVWNDASLNALEFENAEAFKNGIVSQQVMWSGFMTLQNPETNPEYHDVLMSRDFPVGGPNPDPTRTGMKGGFGLAIPKASDNVELAFEFAKFVVSRDNAETFIEGGGQPSNATLLERYAKEHRYQVFDSIAKGIAHGHHMAQFPEGPQLFQIITQHMGDLATGGSDPESACAAMKRDTERLFRRAGYI